MESRVVILNNEEYKVFENEFTPLYIQKYCNLKMYNDFRELERLSGLLKELTTLSLFNIKANICLINISHGGFIAFEIEKTFNEININTSKEHEININYRKNNFIFKDNYAIGDNCDILFDQSELEDYENTKNTRQQPDSFIVVSKYKCKFKSYKLSNSDYYVNVSHIYLDKFLEEFSYFIKDTSDTGSDTSDELNYDNLMHFTMIVKNAGDILEEVLTKNLPNIDMWTILDTGSTDNTVEIINKVLVGKKKGTLYQEPFINFRESRNRCLDLASNRVEPCKYIIMLDDTYIIEGNLREFLNTTRSDQFSSSFSLFIKSDDVEYSSNRIIKTKNNLRYIYTIHEVIQKENNICVCVYLNDSFISDKKSDYMNQRTMERKKYDLEQLFLMVENYPNDSRHLYYIAQTYNLIKNYEKSLEYFIKRVNHPDRGYLQERIDSYFEAARICNFKLMFDWDVCKSLYEKAYELDTTRPDSLYFLGIHYIIDEKDKDNKIAYDYMKRAFSCGYPENSQHSLKPTLYYHFLLKYLVQLCYYEKDYELGLSVCSLYINCGRNDIDKDHNIMVNWMENFKLLNQKVVPSIPVKQYCVMIVDGNWQPWTGRDILTKGLGGSETSMVELSRYLYTHKVVFFCRCSVKETFENVDYMPIEEYHSFIRNNYIDTVIISRFSSYVSDCIQAETVNKVFLIFHDIVRDDTMILHNNKLKGVFCLSDFHCKQFLSLFPNFRNIVMKFHYGIALEKFPVDRIIKVPYKFIYSSFPNRGLLPLLQMWPRIKKRYETATLHIFCDIDGKWVNEVYKDGIIKIKELLDEYKYDMGIVYRSFVPKEELYKEWLSSDVWFYPNIFEETFCLTAYEAAASKTLAITTNLGALPEVNKSVILKCKNVNEVFDYEWQNYALNILYSVLDNGELKNRLINDNYDNVKDKHWYSRAQELAKIIEYIS